MSSIRDVGTVIHVLRVIRNQSQGELARISGVRNSSISNYERGKAVPKFETLQKLADGLGVPLSAVEQTQAFIDHVRASTETAGGAEPSEVSMMFGETREGPVPGSREAEAEKVAAEVGRAAHRFTRLLLQLFEERSAAGTAGLGEEEER